MKWICFFGVMFIGLLAGCSGLAQSPTEQAKIYENNFEIVGEEREQLLKDVSGTIYENYDRSNEDAEEYGTFLENEPLSFQLPEGRYTISGEGAGNVEIVDEEGNFLIDEVISRGNVNSITVTVTNYHTIEVDGMDMIMARPAQNSSGTEFQPGIWEVGTDIAEGSYTITGGQGQGYVQVFSEDQQTRVYEVIGGESGASESEITLHEGEKIKVTSLPFVFFEPVE